MNRHNLSLVVCTCVMTLVGYAAGYMHSDIRKYDRYDELRQSYERLSLRASELFQRTVDQEVELIRLDESKNVPTLGTSRKSGIPGEQGPLVMKYDE